ncbi:SDR family NAD(P)-dependent oxidoreductase [bacterium]|nr:SDR family NAD(P)-dependent oxidoreductase [bacterium]
MLKSKTYVITGSTSGIGKELVKVFSKNPKNVVFAGYRNSAKIPPNLEKNVINFYIDMTDRVSIANAVEFIKSKIDRVDTLINVAGCVTAGPIENIDTNRLREQFDVNTFSHIELTQGLVDILDNGRIINISSMASFGNFPFISPYCASKRALDIFFNAFSLENHRNIKVVSIKPGVIATPIWGKSVESNWQYLDSCKDYEKELNFIKNNALKNSNCGLDVSHVAKVVLQVDRMKNPKPSYTVGYDAMFAKILSLMPQGVVNKLIKIGMKSRISKS